MIIYNKWDKIVKRGVKYEEINLINDDFDYEKIEERVRKGNVKLIEIFYKIEKFGQIKYKVIEATLSYEPVYCHRCGCVFDKEQTYEKNGFKV